MRPIDLLDVRWDNLRGLCDRNLELLEDLGVDHAPFAMPSPVRPQPAPPGYAPRSLASAVARVGVRREKV